LSSLAFPPDERIFILSFANQKYQSQALARISCYCEDQTRKGQIIDVDSFEALRDVPAKNYAGHNLPLDHILSFLQAVGPLTNCTDFERRVIQELERKQYIRTIKGGQFTSVKSNCIIIAFVESRIKDLKHEIQHGFFYVDNDYRKSCEQEWASLPETIRSYVSTTLFGLGYCVEVHCDEFQAYLVQEPQTFSVSGTNEMLAARKTLASHGNSQLVSRLRDYKDVTKLSSSSDTSKRENNVAKQSSNQKGKQRKQEKKKK